MATLWPEYFDHYRQGGCFIQVVGIVQLEQRGATAIKRWLLDTLATLFSVVDFSPLLYTLHSVV